VRHLVAADLSAPLLVLATFRDTEIDHRHPVTGLLADVARHEHHAQRLLLEGLDRGEVEELVEAASGDPLTDNDLRFAGALFDRTEGNPFFASQLLRHIDEARAAFSDELPEGVRDVIARRLARLGDPTNAMLKAAAVCGESFAHALIARVAGMPNVDAAISQAVGARILVDDGRGGYRFTHAIVREALLSLQTAVERARYHAAAATTLVTLHGEGLSAPLHDLAHHAAAAAILGNTRDAARYAIKAADACMKRADRSAAIDVLNRAWHAIEQVEPLDHEARFDVCNVLAELHFQALDGVVDALEAAAVSARALDSAERLVELATHSYRWDVNNDDPFAMQLVDDALTMLGSAPTAKRALALANGAYLANFLSQGNPKPFADEALGVLAQLDDRTSPDAVLATEHVALSLMGHGGAKRALGLAESVRDQLFSTPVPPIGPIFLSGEAAAYVGMGDRDGWDSVIRALNAYSARTGDPMAVVYARSCAVIEALFEGRFTEAPAMFARAMEGVGVAVANIPQVMAVWSMWLAYEEGKSADIIAGLRVVVEMTQGTPGMGAAFAAHLAEMGDVDEAREIITKLAGELPTAGRNATFGSLVSLMAMATAVTGDEAVAQMLLDELEPWKGEIVIVPSVVAVGSADRYRGCMLTLLGRDEEAVAALESAIALEERLGVPPFIARSRYWLARALRARGAYGDDARARLELKACLDEAERLGMASVASAAAGLLSSR
jgi:tetratricopeptide (TPR) repeat protein